MQNELTRALTDQLQANHQRAVEAQNLYGQLINWRTKVLDNPAHKRKVLSGYAKIRGFLARAV